MKNYFAYIRPKLAVSIAQQRRQLERFARRNRIRIARWFEEGRPLSATGRPVFRNMLADLRKGKAIGAIAESPERLTRNLSEWAKLGELATLGIDFRFVEPVRQLNPLGNRNGRAYEAIQQELFARAVEAKRRKTSRP